MSSLNIASSSGKGIISTSHITIFHFFNNVYNELDENILIIFFKWKIIYHYLDAIPNNNIMLPLKLYSNGILEQPPKQRIIIGLLRKYYIDELNEIAEKCFEISDNEKVFVDNIFGKLKKTFIKMIENSSLSDTGKKDVIFRIKNVTIKIATYNTVKRNVMIDDSYWKNIDRINNAIILRITNEINLNDVNNMYSSFPIFTTNAYYDDILNQIKISRGLFYGLFKIHDRLMCDVMGTNGFIIAHELSHCIDKTSNKVNNLISNKDDLKYFNDEIDKIKSFYKKKYQISSKNIDENMADIIGLKMAYLTYVNYYMESDKIDKIEAIKIFLKSYADLWKSKTNEFVDIKNQYIDTHSTSSVRINAPLSHMPFFYKYYDINPQNKLYIDPKLRFNMFNEMF